MYAIIISMVLSGVMVVLMMVLMVRSQVYSNMLSVYECGFDSSCKTHKVFSYRFFLISVLFLIFDVEVVLLLPTPYLIGGDVGLFIYSMIVSILVGGVLYEMSYGVLVWLR